MNVIALLVGGVGTGFVVGGAFGARHALEPDHVTAVATLVEEEQRPSLTGASWGIGHSLPILLLGAIFLALNLRVPNQITTASELLVAFVLVALGLRVVAGRESLGYTVLQYFRSDDSRTAVDGHFHVTLGMWNIGFTHSHTDQESFAVGIIHGLAGSGGVVIALAAAAPTVAQGSAFLVGFSLASIAAMALAAWSWGNVVDRDRRLRLIAGLFSIVVGILLFVKTAGVPVMT